MYRTGIYKDKGLFGKPDVENIEVPDQFKVKNVANGVVGEASIEQSMLDGEVAAVTAGVNSIRETDKQIIVDLTTKEGPLRGFFWKNERSLEDVENGLGSLEVADITGKWNEFPKGSGNFSIQMSDYKESDTDIEELLPYVNESREELTKELFHYISMMSEETQALTKHILEQVWDEFSFIPAARGMHHHQYGGLLQHTVENLRIAVKFAKQGSVEEVRELCEKTDRYVRRALFVEKKFFLEQESEGKFFSKFNDVEGHHSSMYLGLLRSLRELDEFNIDLDVVIFSTIFHDIGKIMEYSYAGGDNERYATFFPGFEFSEGDKSIGADMDTHGVRLGHITLGIVFLTRTLTEYGLTDGDFLMNVLSCLSSHHGRQEWGSPTIPNKAEEYIVHLADVLGSSFGSELLYANS